MDSDVDYCLTQIRRLDRDRALTVLAAPGRVAADLAVLYAFNLELAVIRDSVSEPMLGQIRFQWWREAIAELYAGKPRRHAVLNALADLNRRRPLGRAWFERMIDARVNELETGAPIDLAGLESYADATSGSLLALAAEAAGLDAEAGECAQLIHHVGIAFGLTGTARATLHLARQRRTMLPVALIAAAGVSLDTLYELKPQPALNQAIATLAGMARGHLAAARKLPAPPALKPALRVAIIASRQLAQLARHGHDLFDPKSIEPSPRDIWRLALSRMLGTW